MPANTGKGPGPLLIADSPLLLYRAFFALPDTILGADKKPVNALLGAVNQLLWAIEHYPPRAVVACFGQESASYRVAAYPPYHAARPPMPDELRRQWLEAPALFEAFGWSVERHDDLEADDVLAALAATEENAGGSTLILTGDRDLLQCASESTTVLLIRGGPSRGDGPDQVDPDGVIERYGVEPALVPDFIALRGDPSDGIPGAKGIGEKTAAELLRRHGSLDAVLAGALREKPGVRKALIDHEDELRMFRDIATVQRFEIARPADRPTNFAAGATAARERGINRLAERLEKLADV